MDPTIISEALKPEILELLHQGRFDDVLSKIETRPPKKKGFFDFLKKSSDEPESHFSYEILSGCLNKTLEPKEYTRIAKLDFGEDFIKELIELFRIILVLDDCGKEPETERLVALTSLECVRDGAIYIGENANDYPQNSINAKVWMDGAGLRTRANELSNYFNSKNDNQNTLEALFLKAKITNTVMNHYPNMVGPDMIAVALQLEKMGNIENAKQFLEPVVMDFTGFVREIEEGLANPEVRVSEEEVAITESLVNALEGLKRLGEMIDESKLKRAQGVLGELKQRL